MVWKLLIIFVAAFLVGFLTAGGFTKKKKDKPDNDGKTDGEVRVLTNNEKQKMYN